MASDEDRDSNLEDLLGRFFGPQEGGKTEIRMNIAHLTQGEIGEAFIDLLRALHAEGAFEEGSGVAVTDLKTGDIDDERTTRLKELLWPLILGDEGDSD